MPTDNLARFARTIPQMFGAPPGPTAPTRLDAAKALSQAGEAYGDTDPADKAWFQLHADILAQHLWRDTPECCQVRARMYHRFAQMYPSYADVANREAAKYMAMME